MQIYSKTDTGKMRHTNQDAYNSFELDGNTVFAIVCDGMGGANAGNIASENAVKIISEYIKRSYRKNMDFIGISSLLKSAVVSANMELYDMSLKNPDLNGMGTTAVVAAVRENSAVICHVGDSRAYLVSGDSIAQLTTDHSMVQSLVESGKLTPEQAKIHPRKNVITRALGAEENVLVDCVDVNMVKGDTILLCSDGLTNFVEVKDILKAFKNNDISVVAEFLTNCANNGGGGDNITVVTVTV